MPQRASLRQLRASAGSGKTYALTNDVLRLLAEAGIVPRAYSHRNGIISKPNGCNLLPSSEQVREWPEILAVTFTNRAAAEMKERVLARLKNMALGLSPTEHGWTKANSARAVENLLRDFNALNMRTIDSLIHLIVRMASLDLGLPPDAEPVFAPAELFAPLIDELAEQARAEAAHPYADDSLAQAFRQACWHVLTHSNHKGFLAGNTVRRRLVDLSQFLLNQPDLIERLASPEATALRLSALCERVLGLAKKMLNCIEQENLAADKRFCAALEKCVAPDAELPIKSAYLDEKTELDECLNTASRKKASPLAYGIYLRLIEAQQHLTHEGKVLRHAQQFLPYVALARRVLAALPAYQFRAGKFPATLTSRWAAKVLSGQYGVSEAFCRMGTRISHILVDEFQDTSLEQWYAIMPLAVEALARGGSLTIVGDVKQAIYSWRGGEATLFDIVPELPALQQLAHETRHETLAHNWRSRKIIVHWNNAVFRQLANNDTAQQIMAILCPVDSPKKKQDDGNGDDDDMLLDESGMDAALALSTTFRKASQVFTPKKDGGFVRISPLPEPQDSASDESAPAVDDSADPDHDTMMPDPTLETILCQRVEELGLSRPWGDICILTRRNEETAQAAAWLLARNIPVITQGSLLLAEQALVAQVVCLLTFLNNPDDDAVFWAVLAGNELLPLATQACLEPASSVLHTLSREHLHDWAAQRACHKKINGTLAQAFRTDFPAAWDVLFAPLHDTAGLLTPYDTACEILERWQVMERHPEASGFLLRFLEVLHSAEQQGLSDLSGFLEYWNEHGREEKAPLPESMNAVNIMTIHKAKGLQFEVVLTPWLDFGIKAGTNPTLYEADGLTLVAPMSKALQPAYRQALVDNAREMLNLLYVAWTRAIAELHIFLPASPKNMGKGIYALIAPVLKRATPGPDGGWTLGEQTRPPAPLSPLFTAAVPATDLPIVPSVAPAYDKLPPGQLSALPMDWLPRLKIFRSPLEEWGLSATRRGTLVHHCLELLRLSGSPSLDAAIAVRHGLDTFPLPVPERPQVEAELTELLAWYAALPEVWHWLAFGTPEHTLLDARAKAHRVDLLVDDGTEMVAVEYKTGTPGILPNSAHIGQLHGYLNLLRQASDLPCRGVLVYLDRREIIYCDGDHA